MAATQFPFQPNFYNLEPKYLISLVNNELRTTSAKVADAFGKLHKNIIQRIESLDCSAEFASANFSAHVQQVEVGNGAKRDSKYYEMTKDGFMFLVMGFTGKKAAMIKEAYINAFNWMAGQLLNRPEQKTTVDTRTPLRDAVNMLVAKKKLMYPDAYAIVHQRFAVGHIDELTQEQIPQAVEYVHRLVLEGEWMPPQKELPLVQEGYLLTEQEAAALSGVFSWAKRSASLLKDMEAPLRLLKSSLAPDAFDGGNEIWPHLRNTEKVREYAQQASLALQRRVLG